MASTIKAELDKANPVNTPDLFRLSKVGSGLAVSARYFSDTIAVVTANILTLPATAKGMQIIWCYARAAGAPGEIAVAAAETTPGAGNCARNQIGDVEFAAADAVTEAEVIYIPVEGDLVTETIPVTAGGAGTFNGTKRGLLLMSATLNAPGAAPGVKIVNDRATASAAGNCALTLLGTGVTFNAADCTAACTADVTYYAAPGIGNQENGLGARLDTAFTP